MSAMGSHELARPGSPRPDRDVEREVLQVRRADARALRPEDAGEGRHVPQLPRDLHAISDPAPRVVALTGSLDESLEGDGGAVPDRRADAAVLLDAQAHRV